MCLCEVKCLIRVTIGVCVGLRCVGVCPCLVRGVVAPGYCWYTSTVSCDRGWSTHVCLSFSYVKLCRWLAGCFHTGLRVSHIVCMVPRVRVGGLGGCTPTCERSGCVSVYGTMCVGPGCGRGVVSGSRCLRRNRQVPFRVYVVCQLHLSRGCVMCVSQDAPLFTVLCGVSVDHSRWL